MKKSPYPKIKKLVVGPGRITKRERQLVEAIRELCKDVTMGVISQDLRVNPESLASVKQARKAIEPYN